MALGPLDVAAALFDRAVGAAQRALAEILHQQKGREEVVDRRGQFRVPRRVFRDRRPLTASPALEELVGQ